MNLTIAENGNNQYKKGENDMLKVRKIQNGDGINFTIIHNYKPVNFKVTLVERNFLTKVYEFIFISECGKYWTYSAYSGGNTGFGIDLYSICETSGERFQDYKIISDDIEEINEIVAELTLKDEKKREEQLKELYEKTDRINKLPNTFETPFKGLVFIRDEAEFNPVQSSYIRGGKIYLKRVNEKYFNIEGLRYYTTRNGGRKLKMFEQAYGEILSNNGYKTRKEISNAFDILLKQNKELEQMVKDA